MPATSPVTHLCATPSLPTGAGSGLGQLGSTVHDGALWSEFALTCFGCQIPKPIASASKTAIGYTYRPAFISFSISSRSPESRPGSVGGIVEIVPTCRHNPTYLRQAQPCGEVCTFEADEISYLVSSLVFAD